MIMLLPECTNNSSCVSVLDETNVSKEGSLSACKAWL